MQQGGKFYGEGMWGETYDFACKLNDNETFCKKLKSKRITAIHLHSFTKLIQLDKQSQIVKFIRYMHNLDCCVAKVFKDYGIGLDEKGFNDELAGMKTIYDIFGKDTTEQTTLTSLKLFNFNFVAAKVIFSDDTSIFATFSKKCTSNLTHTKVKSIDHILKHLIHTLVIMQKHDFIHCDIKPDNIIYCKSSNKFKLIDWGLANKLSQTTKYSGTVLFSSPMAHYLSGVPAFIAVRIISYTAWQRMRDWYNSTIFQELYKLIYQEFYEAIEGQTPQELFNKYKYKFDLFNLGMALAFVVHKNKLKWHKYKNKIISLVSLKGALSAADV